jgi:hypothetical protein
MSGHGEKLTRKKEAAIAALLSEPTVAAAAQKAAVAESTLRRWLTLPDFQAAYSAERRSLLERTASRLLSASTHAVNALIKNLVCGIPAAEIRAALGILDQASKSVELLDLSAQLAELREKMEVIDRERSMPRRRGFA